MTKKRYGNELHPLYSRWLTITQRCNNPNHVSYKNYGAKGIHLAADLRSFEDFKTYMMSLPNYDPDNLSIDRIEGGKCYEKGNLRWATQSTQLANQETSGKGRNSFTGVCWNKTHQRWVARINFEGKTLFTKVCKTEEAAVKARNHFIVSNGLPHKLNVI